jgi:hypothetical protein
MGITVWPVDAVGGAPEYSGRDLRQALSPALAGATATRPLGALSGVRPGTPADTVEVSGSTWTCHPHAGVIDGQSAAEAGPYWYAVDADVTGSVDAANATNPRMDLIYARVSDPAESDGSTDPEVEILYLAGTAASSPTPPATPARSIPLAVLNVPKVGGGATTVTWVAPYMAAPGGLVYVRTGAERDALAAALAPTAESPLLVFRGDAGAGRELEYTTDGASWTTVPAYSAAPVPQTYTPSLSGPNLGSGSSVSGWYKVRADLTVEVDIKATLGTGFSLTNMVFGYPPGLVPIEAMREAPATAFFVDANGPRANAVAYCGGAGIAVVAQGSNGVGTAITNSFPFSWAAGDQIRVQTTYSVAA